MQWERLNWTDFKKAVETSGQVCVLPMGVLEKHGPHAAIGTDLLSVHAAACEAATIEPAVVFPYYYFSQIYEARHQAGTIAIKPRLLYDLLENVCDEIARNGFKKIILLNGHGGNNHFLPFFCQCMLAKEKDYLVYMSDMGFSQGDKLKALMESKEDYHGGEVESSLMMALGGDLMNKSYVPRAPSEALPRMQGMHPVYTGIWWYSQFPDHYGGDANPASAEKGKKFMTLFTEYVADVIRKVKKDREGPALQAEFFKRTKH
jgi:creatinine amidohydrolase